MADEKLPSFKIADKHKPRVKASATARTEKAEGPEEGQFTLGFARIESILDSEDPGVVGARLAQMLDDLDAKLAAASTPKEKTACKKGRAAVERTIDMLDHLFRTKEALTSNAVEAAKK